MHFDLRQLQKQQAAKFQQMQLTITQLKDQQKREKFYYTFAEKQNDWIGTTLINFILRHKIDQNQNDYYIFYERTVEVGKILSLTPTNSPDKLILLNKIKLFVSKGNYLTLAYSSMQSKLQEISIKFKDPTVAKQWQNLIRMKRNEAKNHTSQRSSAIQGQKLLEMKSISLQKELQRQRAQKDELLLNLNILTQNLNHYKNQVVALQNQNKQLRDSLCRHDNTGETQNNLIQRLKDCCNNHETEMSVCRAKMFTFESANIEADKRLLESETKRKMEKLQYQGKQANLKKINEQLKLNINMHQVFSRQLINKILQKNELLRQMQQDNNSLQLSRSVFIENEQDYASIVHNRHLQRSP